MTSFSQASQDLFVRYAFENKRGGTFVDVGCQLPETINNTCMLERELGWYGVSIDVQDFSKEWTVRDCPFVCADALTCDFGKALYGLPAVVDYLNVDIEGMGCRFQALKRAMDGGRTFKVVTVEHDAYRGYGESERKPQRALLSSLGYELLCADVCAGDGTPFEDWWVNPQYVPLAPRIMVLKADGERHSDIIARVRDEIEGYG